MFVCLYQRLTFAVRKIIESFITLITSGTTVFFKAFTLAITIKTVPSGKTSITSTCCKK